MKYNIVACGGTFDYFHKGHASFLDFCFQHGEKVIIGITSDVFIQNAKKTERDAIQPFVARKKAVQQFLRAKGWSARAAIVSLDDTYGPTLIDGSPVDALIVSENVLEGASVINKKRISFGLSSLPLVVHTMLKGEDNVMISSSNIRKGRTNREGRPYIKSEWLVSPLLLSKKARTLCKRPLGLLQQHILPNQTIDYVVGDVSTTFCNTHHVPYKLAVVDLFVERKKRFASLNDFNFPSTIQETHVKNSAGVLTPELFRTIEKAVAASTKEKPWVLQVDGEEDLSVLPLLLYSPLQTTIVYGQPGKGMVVVVVTEKAKEKAYKIVSLCKENSISERTLS